MSRLLDARACPDCRGPLDATATCRHCGLRLHGPVAGRLWEALVSADGLIEQLRRAPAPAEPTRTHPVGQHLGRPADRPEPVLVPPSAGYPAPGRPPVPPGPALPPPPTPAGPTSGLPPFSPPPAPRPQRRLPAMSVQVVLLGLGALCLIVAAIVFVAVTWSTLGLGARASILLGFTGVLAAAAAVLTRKDLRGGAETFWLVVAGMLVVDLVAAQSADLLGLGSLGWRGTLALVGSSQLLVGLGAPLWSRTQPIRRLYGVQPLAVVGAALIVIPHGWAATHPAPGTALSVAVLAGLWWVLRDRVVLAAWGLGALSVVSWLVLLVIGLNRTSEAGRDTVWWTSPTGWPLIAAAVLAAGILVALPRMWIGFRVAWAAGSLVAIAVFLHGPSGRATPSVLLTCLVIAGLALVTAFAPRAWAWGSAVLTVPALFLLGLVLLVWPLGVVDLSRFADLELARRLSPPTGGVSPWVAPALAATVLLVLWGLGRLAGRLVAPRLTAPARAILFATAPAVALTGVVVPVLWLAPPRWLAVVALLVAVAASVAGTWRQRHHLVGTVVGCLATSYLTMVLLLLAAPSHLLSAGATSLLVVGVAATYARAASGRTTTASRLVAPSLLGALAVLGGGYAVAQWAAFLGDSWQTTTLALSVYAGAVAVSASRLSWALAPRLSLEGSAAIVGFVSILLSSDLADDRSTALVLMMLGTALALSAVLERDRAALGGAALVLLAGATGLAGQADLRLPELVPQPAALLLLGLGSWGLRRAPDLATLLRFGAGVLIALLPDLLGVSATSVIPAIVVTVVALLCAGGFATQERVAPVAPDPARQSAGPGLHRAVAPVLVAVATLLGGRACWAWTHDLDLDWLVSADLGHQPAALLLAVYAALLAIAARWLTRTSTSRITLEISAAFVGLLALPQAETTTSLAWTLTVLVAGVAAVAILDRERAVLAWAMVPLIAVALGVRAGTDALYPELYTLPVVAVMLLVGTWGMRAAPDAINVSRFGAGVFSALLPVLLWVRSTEVISGIVLTVVTAAAAFAYTHQELARRRLAGPVLAVLTGLVGAGAVLTWTELAAQDRDVNAVALAIYAAALGIAAARVSRTVASRISLEVVAGVLALTALPFASDLAMTALVLTVIGSAVAIVVVLHPDRVHLGWASTVLLGISFLIRLELEVRAPELYTLPAALLLVAAGAWRLRTDEHANSFLALGSGLTLGLVPSLLLALEDPVSLRGALIAAGGLVVLASGARFRLVTPLGAGALTTAALAVRHLEPVAQALPRWITLGSVGVILLIVGITWEARLKNLKRAGHYLQGLR